MPKSKEFIASDSDSSDDEPRKKKSKPEKKKAAEGGSSKSGAERGDAKGEENKFELGRNRFITVDEFKGKPLIQIREYYDAGGELKPGKRGIALKVDEWEKLKKFVNQVDKALEKY